MWYLLLGVPVFIGLAVWMSQTARGVISAQASLKDQRSKKRARFSEPNFAARERNSGGGRHKPADFGRR